MCRDRYKQSRFCDIVSAKIGFFLVDVMVKVNVS